MGGKDFWELINNRLIVEFHSFEKKRKGKRERERERKREREREKERGRKSGKMKLVRILRQCWELKKWGVGRE